MCLGLSTRPSLPHTCAFPHRSARARRRRGRVCARARAHSHTHHPCPRTRPCLERKAATAAAHTQTRSLPQSGPRSIPYPLSSIHPSIAFYALPVRGPGRRPGCGRCGHQGGLPPGRPGVAPRCVGSEGAGRGEEEGEAKARASAPLSRSSSSPSLFGLSDKNQDRQDEAADRFKEIQNAYEVLSDKHERAWYDSHRDAILRSGSAYQAGGDGGGSGQAPDSEFDLYSFFSAACYRGYGDGPHVRGCGRERVAGERARAGERGAARGSEAGPRSPRLACPNARRHSHSSTHPTHP